MIKEFGGPIAQKYARIDWAGRKALEHEGEIKEFKGFGENLKNRFLTVLRFSPESEQTVKERVIDKIAQAGNDLGIDFVFAIRDFSLHSTVEEGLFQGDEASVRDENFRALSGDEKIKQLQKEIPSDPLIYKYFLIDKGNLILTAVEIPKEIIKLRQKLDAAYAAHGLKPLPMEHILHITIGRMEKLPSENQMEKLQEYRKRMIKLRQEITKDPLKLSVANMFAGNTYDFLSGKQVEKKIT